MYRTWWELAVGRYTPVNAVPAAARSVAFRPQTCHCRRKEIRKYCGREQVQQSKEGFLAWNR